MNYYFLNIYLLISYLRHPAFTTSLNPLFWTLPPFHKLKLLAPRNLLNDPNEYITMAIFNKDTYLLNDIIICNRCKMTMRNMYMGFRKLSLLLLILSKVILFNV